MNRLVSYIKYRENKDKILENIITKLENYLDGDYLNDDGTPILLDVLVLVDKLIKVEEDKINKDINYV